MNSAKRCRVCGDELECLDYGGGSVWSCDTHGVRDWHFGGEGPALGLGLNKSLPAVLAPPRGPRMF